MNCLLDRQFTYNANPYFLWKMIKMSSATISLGALRVNINNHFYTVRDENSDSCTLIYMKGKRFLHWIQLTMAQISIHLYIYHKYLDLQDLSYHNKPKYWDRRTSANSIDPYQMPHSAAFDQGPHCLQHIQQILDALTGNNMDVKILGPIW